MKFLLALIYISVFAGTMMATRACDQKNSKTEKEIAKEYNNYCKEKGARLYSPSIGCIYETR